MFDNFEDKEYDLQPEVNVQEIIDNLSKYDSKKLCDIIICYRYLSLNKDLSILCMEELGKRRIIGDNFDFENYIDKSQKDLPTLNFSIPDIGAFLKNISFSNKK